MPLFNIVGVTAINTSFFVGFCFLDNEDTESFQWVLERLHELYDEMGIPRPTTIISDSDFALLEARKRVFPGTNHLLCVWHVFKNVLAHCKAKFKKDLAIQDRDLSVEDVHTKVAATWEELLPDLQQVIYAKTEHDYETAWAAFQTKWAPQYPQVPAYIYETWLLRYKTMIVTAWTNHVLHFGNTATSRAERAHLVVKDAIHNSCGDLDTVLNHISIILQRHQDQYRAELARQAASRPTKLLNSSLLLMLSLRSFLQGKPAPITLTSAMRPQRTVFSTRYGIRQQSPLHRNRGAICRSQACNQACRYWSVEESRGPVLRDIPWFNIQELRP
jgi:hypothetical protein